MKKNNLIIVVLCLFAITNLFAEQYNELKYEIIDNKITITRCSASCYKIAIPAEINGIPVTSIRNSAFFSCGSLISINIPDSVTSIGDDAFKWCESLSSINIPDSVTSIGKGAFSGCNSLTSINIPYSVISIGEKAFSACNSLTSLNIPNSVTSIGEDAFSYCSSLMITIENDKGYPYQYLVKRNLRFQYKPD